MGEALYNYFGDQDEDSEEEKHETLIVEEAHYLAEKWMSMGMVYYEEVQDIHFEID